MWIDRLRNLNKVRNLKGYLMNKRIDRKNMYLPDINEK